MEKLPLGAVEFHPLIPERWVDLEKLFGKHGAYGGCWCMYWRLTRKEWNRLRGEPNRLAFKAIVESGTVPGLLAYSDGEPAGWCAIQPREAYPSLDRSRTLARVDNKSVWSITCFFVARRFRRQGLMRSLVAASVNWADNNGARIVEAYPMDEGVMALVPEPWADLTANMGVMPVFRGAGFVEVLRRSKRQPIMRKLLT